MVLSVAIELAGFDRPTAPTKLVTISSVRTRQGPLTGTRSGMRGWIKAETFREELRFTTAYEQKRLASIGCGPLFAFIRCVTLRPWVWSRFRRCSPGWRWSGRCRCLAIGKRCPRCCFSSGRFLASVPWLAGSVGTAAGQAGVIFAGNGLAGQGRGAIHGSIRPLPEPRPSAP